MCVCVYIYIYIYIYNVRVTSSDSRYNTVHNDIDAYICFALCP